METKIGFIANKMTINYSDELHCGSYILLVSHIYFIFISYHFGTEFFLCMYSSFVRPTFWITQKFPVSSSRVALDRSMVTSLKQGMILSRRRLNMVSRWQPWPDCQRCSLVGCQECTEWFWCEQSLYNTPQIVISKKTQIVISI